MSLLQASTYKPTATGYLPMLKSLDVPEVLASAASNATTSLATTVCLTSAPAPCTFTPAVVPPIGAVKKFVQGGATNAVTITAGGNAIFVKGPNNVGLAAQVVLGAALTQYAVYQFVGINASGLQMYRLIETNSATVF